MIAECLLVEFRVTGESCPLANASRTAGVTIDARPPQRRSDGNDLLRFSAPAGAVADLLDEDDRIRYLHVARTDGRDDFRCLSRRPCLVHELTDAGLLSERLIYRSGVEHHTGAVVGHDVLQGVLRAAGDHGGVQLQRVTPLADDESAPVDRRWDLTPKQAAAIETALSMGYFAVPKGATAEEVAAELGVGKSAFLERLRRGQAALFAQLFEMRPE